MVLRGRHPQQPHQLEESGRMIRSATATARRLIGRSWICGQGASRAGRGGVGRGGVASSRRRRSSSIRHRSSVKGSVVLWKHYIMCGGLAKHHRLASASLSKKIVHLSSCASKHARRSLAATSQFLRKDDRGRKGRRKRRMNGEIAAQGGGRGRGCAAVGRCARVCDDLSEPRATRRHA